MKKVLITGASGFIGSHLCQMLINQGYTVAAMVHQKSMRLKHPRLKVFKSDLSQSGIIDVLSSFKPTYLIHTAAINPSVLAGKNHLDFNHFNHQVTMKLANQFVEFNDQSYNSSVHLPRKFINLSTYEIYGESIDPLGHDEQAGLNPLTDYASSKAKTHHQIEQMNLDYVDFINVVCSNNYGPWQSSEKLIPAVFNRLIQDKAIDLYGDGTSKRTWTFVTDTCSGILQVMLNGNKKRYHLSSNEEASVESMVVKVHQIMRDKNIIQTHEPKIDWYPADLNPSFKMNDRASKDDLKWRAETALQNGLSITIDYLIGAHQS